MTTTINVVRQPKESQGEYLCRKALTEIYNKPFPSCRPDFLQNPITGNNLELDGYNEELAIAFEYNGEQHYRFPNIFHKTQAEFEKQIAHDKWKFDQCEKNGVYLINIPFNVEYSAIRDFIEYYLPETVLKRQLTNQSNNQLTNQLTNQLDNCQLVDK